MTTVAGSSGHGTALSPDGRSVAFVRSRVWEEGNRTHAEVWMVGTDGGSGPIRLTSLSTEASNPRWSPDGRLLSFSLFRPVAGEQSQGSTWFLRTDTPGEAFQIEGLGGNPAFDPTNEWIAFTRAVRPVSANMMLYPASYLGGWTPWRYLHRLYSTREWWREWLKEKPIS